MYHRVMSCKQQIRRCVNGGIYVPASHCRVGDVIGVPIENCALVECIYMHQNLPRLELLTE
jgi:hypothetical protein